MRCPKCKTDTLISTTIGHFSIDQCETCTGIWFDAAELKKLLREAPSRLSALRPGAASPERNATYGDCPRDTTPLLRVYSALNRAVIMDACPRCKGRWLDGGEFGTLLRSSE